MNRIMVLNAFMLSLFCPLAANAVYDERWYRVEIIVFAHNDHAALQEEYWPEEPGLPDMSDAVSLVTDVKDSEHLPGQRIEFKRLPVRMLSNALSLLQRSDRYRIIHATAWSLPGLSRRRAPPVRIRAGRRYTLAGTVMPSVPDIYVQSAISQAGQQKAEGAVDDVLYEIDGQIKISLSRYLDVDTDLVFHDNVFLPGPDGVPIQSFRAFRLTEFRRMRSRTIHYLDHPMFGVVIGINRL